MHRNFNNNNNPLLSWKPLSGCTIECTINLARLFDTDRQRRRFEARWPDFLASDPYNPQVYRKTKNRLVYRSEQLIPPKRDRRPPLLLVFGNPATCSVVAGCFFSFDEKRGEHRFWKQILQPAGVIDLPHDAGRPATTRNRQRRQALLNGDYNSRFRLGWNVLVSMPSGASVKDWSGVAGIQRLLGAAALRKLEAEDARRVIDSAREFVKPGGAVIAFQKDAWNRLKSGSDPDYCLAAARAGTLRGTLAGRKKVPLLCAPPTRLPSVCRRGVEQLVAELVCGEAGILQTRRQGLLRRFAPRNDKK